ncbi:craniofacial development protein 2-like [Saccostrea cucullata]|uniref:craniofacial development protein 2-like n=1 Tax=Saccostrea cuccullata TaxID=36930 RepID=UPI002ED6961D
MITDTRTRRNSSFLEASEYQQPSARMNAASESQQEAGRMKSILSTRTKLKIGFWNVRTMYEAGKQAQVVREMKNNKLHILGVSECRWTDFGKIMTNSGEVIIYSGRKDGRHHEGVAIILSKAAGKSLIEYHPVSERMMRARLDTKPIKTSIIQVYSPTNEAEDETKQDFYEALQAELEKITKHDLTIIMGDFNAKIGQDNTGYERVMGKYGCGTMNENGEHLAEFCGNNNMVIGGTLFPHKDIHKLTWISPGGRDKNQIDHIVINGKWKRSLQDVRVRRGADVGSDHHLVTADFKLKLMKTIPKYSWKRFDVGKLSDTKTKQDFRLELKNRFSILQASDLDEEQIDEHWLKVKDTFNNASEKVIGFRKQIHKEWITPGTWKLIDSRKELKKRL